MKTTRRPWSKSDRRELKQHSRQFTPVRKIAKYMKRTEGALRQKALEMQISLGHQRKYQ